MSISNLKNKVISGVKWTALSSFVIAIAQIIQLLVLSRFLNAHDFGLWAIVNLVIMYTTIFSDLGVSAAVIHYQKTSQNQFSTLYWLNIFSGIILFLIIWLFSPFILDIFDEVRQVDLLLTAALSLPFSASGILFQNVLQKELKFNFLSKVEIGASVIGVSVSVVVAVCNFGVWAFIFGQLSNIIIKSLFLTIRGWHDCKIRFYFNIKEIKPYLRFGSFQIGERSINLLNKRLDQIVIGALIGTEALGYYNFAFNIISKPIVILNPVFTKVAFPLFAKLQKEKKLLKNTYLKLINIIATINAPIFVLIFIIAPIAVPVLFSEKWNDSIILIQVLSGVSFFRSIGNPVGSLVLAMGRADLGFKWNIILFILSIPVIYIAAVVGNALGITIGLLVLQIIILYPNYNYMVKPFIGKSFHSYTIAIIKPLAISLLMFISLLIQYSMSSMNYYYLLGLQILLSIIIYIIFSNIFNKKTLTETLLILMNK